MFALDWSALMTPQKATLESGQLSNFFMIHILSTSCILSFNVLCLLLITANKIRGMYRVRTIN